MDTARKYSLIMTFLLAFFIITSDMHTKTQARGVTVENIRCKSDRDCVGRMTCNPDRDVKCIGKQCECIAIHSTNFYK
ncbi:late nodulin protein [Medicago truncatula]|uniref:Late nodulin protein n=1 Tax=Medicago truncatula TaxID=3880 RepID=G7KIZ8_MEDTR|nr:late nodulin protein [Medicago truncatula]